jgi:hypothetical protein
MKSKKKVVTLYMVEDLPFNIPESGVPGATGDGDKVRYKGLPGKIPSSKRCRLNFS